MREKTSFLIIIIIPDIVSIKKPLPESPERGLFNVH